MFLTLYIIGIVWAILMVIMFYFKIQGYCKDNELCVSKHSIETKIAGLMYASVVILLPIFNYILGFSILFMKDTDFSEMMRKFYIDGTIETIDPENVAYSSWAHYGYIYGPYRKDSFINKTMNIQEEPHVEGNFTTRNGSNQNLS